MKHISHCALEHSCCQIKTQWLKTYKGHKILVSKLKEKLKFAT
jgi:hypothetical protein